MFQPSCCLSSLLLSVLHFCTNGRFCNHERLLLFFFWDILRVCLYLPSMASILYLKPFALFSVLLSRQKFSKSGSLRCRGLVYSILFQLSLPTFACKLSFRFFVQVIVGKEYHYLLVRTDLPCIRGGLNIPAHDSKITCTDRSRLFVTNASAAAYDVVWRICSSPI